jgi:hypothetical protein
MRMITEDSPTKTQKQKHIARPPRASQDRNLTLLEASEIVPCSPRFLEKEIKDTRLSAIRLGPKGRMIRIAPKDLQAWLDAQKTGGKK